MMDHLQKSVLHGIFGIVRISQNTERRLLGTHMISSYNSVNLHLSSSLSSAASKYDSMDNLLTR